VPKEWAPYVVKRGEHLSRLAYSRQTTVNAVWTHPKNADLRKVRTNPDVLAPQDIVWLPVEPEREWIPVTTGTANTIKVTIPKHTVKIKLRGEDGKPLAGVAYEVDNGVVPPPGKTESDGTATFDVSLLTASVVVRVPEKKLAIPVLVGDLDPVSTVTGAIGRLRNLGYGRHPSEIDDADPKAYAAFLIAWFQRDHGLPATGKLDQATQDKLSDVGGSDGQGAT
jgi:hypothetical protein